MKDYFSEEPLMVFPDDYPTDTKRLMVYFSVGIDTIGGGTLAILSNYENSVKMESTHGSKVALCRIRENESRTYSMFKNSFYLYEFPEVLQHFKSLDYLMLDFPMCMSDFFLLEFWNNENVRHFIRNNVREFHINIFV